MSLLRATVLLAVLPALATAAPAPLPRATKSSEPGGWSKPVEGLRVRLLAPQTRYRVGETIRLVLEIQNVSGGALVIEEPDLHRVVSGREADGWAITSERRGKGRDRKEVEELKRARDLRRLAAGATLRIEIEARGGGEVKELEKLIEEGPRRLDLHFPDGDVPGDYDFRVTFARGRRKLISGGWNGDSLTSPPVRIELVK
jgi:hypothetical protein